MPDSVLNGGKGPPPSSPEVVDPAPPPAIPPPPPPGTTAITLLIDCELAEVAGNEWAEPEVGVADDEAPPPETTEA